MNEFGLFAAAIDITDPAERAAFLDRECTGLPELRRRLDLLLEAHANVHPLLDEANAAGTEPTPGIPPVSSNAGLVIAGRYKLLQEIGEGGMGTVWMAEQREPVKRLVAIKLIKAGMDTRSVLARFEAERQALALMDHPNIAKVLDGGTTDEGRPFFVMELVKGVPLTEYCDSRRLPIERRLNLFMVICSAVQHAHQKAVIHRDLKPTNILVTEHDGQPVPKVIDFGLAKALDAATQLTEKTLHTAYGTVVGTPLYMAPEQVGINAPDVDTRTDIYALGAILYELLTGTTPLEKKHVKEACWEEVQRLIREEAPPEPSRRLSTSEARPTLSANRGIEPIKLTRILRGDLDWIVMKSLEKDRGRRYESANFLAMDVQRYLSGEPVLAVPPSRVYRLRKFARKYRALIGTVAVVVGLLLAGIAGTGYGLWRAEVRRQQADRARQEESRQRDIAQDNERKAQGNEKRALDAAAAERQAKFEALRERDEKELARQAEASERKHAEAIASFVRDDLLALTTVDGQHRYIDRPASEGLSKDSTLKDLLDRAAEKLGRRKDIEPRTEAKLNWIIGVSYRVQGDAERAIPFLQRSLELHQKHDGPSHRETLTSMNSLGVAYMGAGKLDQALPLLEEALRAWKAANGDDHPMTLLAMNNVGRCNLSAGRPDVALSIFEQMLKLQKARFGAHHPWTLVTMNNLATAYKEAGKLELALPLYEKSRHTHEASLGVGHPDTLRIMGNLAQAYDEAGKPELAVPLLEKTLDLRKATLGADHPDTITAMGALACGYQHAGKTALAMPLFEESLKLRKARSGANHPLTLLAMNNLATAYREARRADLALPLFEEVLRLRKARLGPYHHDTLRTMRNLAVSYHDLRKMDLAIPLYEETLKQCEAKLGPEHKETVATMTNLAVAYWSRGQLDRSVPMFEELVRITEAKRGRNHAATQAAVANLGVNYRDSGQIEKALPLLEEAYASSRTDASLHWVPKQYFKGCVRAGNAEKAAAVARELIDAARKKLSPGGPELASELAHFGLALLQSKSFVEAEPILRECLAIREKSHPDAWTTFNTQSMLGGVLLGQKKYADAEALLLKGYEGMKQREKSIPEVGAARIPESIDRLIQLYTETDRPEEASKWKLRRTEMKHATER